MAKKKKKNKGIGAMGKIPVQELLGAAVGAVVSKKVVPMLTEKLDVAFINDNPMIVKIAKAALGVGITMLVPNALVQGIGIGMAAEASADLVTEAINTAMAGIGTAMDNVPNNPYTPYQIPPQFVNGFAPNDYSQKTEYVNGNKEPVEMEVETVYFI